jgi:hypothetical protein
MIRRFCIKVVVTTRKRLFLIRKLYTSSEVSGECGIRLGFLTFKQLNREIQFSKFQPPYPSYLSTASRAVRYTYNGVQRELAVLPD